MPLGRTLINCGNIQRNILQLETIAKVFAGPARRSFRKGVPGSTLKYLLAAFEKASKELAEHICGIPGCVHRILPLQQPQESFPAKFTDMDNVLKHFQKDASHCYFNLSKYRFLLYISQMWGILCRQV